MAGTKSNYPQKVRDFLAENDKWVREQVRAHSSDAYWIQVKYVLLQAEGLLAGYNQYAPADQKLGYIDWLSFQAQPEMSDIYAAVGVPDELESTLPNYFGTHCSGASSTVLTKRDRFG